MPHPPPPNPDFPVPDPSTDALVVRTVLEASETPVYLAGPAWGCFCHYHKTRHSQPCLNRLTNGKLMCGFCRAIGVKWRTYVPLLERESLIAFVVVGGTRLGDEVKRLPLFAPCLLTRNIGETARSRLLLDNSATTDHNAKAIHLAASRPPVKLWDYLLRLWGNRELAEYYGVTLAADRGCVPPTNPVEYVPQPQETGAVPASDVLAEVLKRRIRDGMKPATDARKDQN